MKVWLELTREEGERLFDIVKGFAVDRAKTTVIKTGADEDAKDKPVSLEQLRALLAEKSQAGKQSEVKALITKYGGNKLTEINADCFEDMLKEAEAL